MLILFFSCFNLHVLEVLLKTKLTPSVKTFHWLPLPLRIKVRLLSLAAQAHGTLPLPTSSAASGGPPVACPLQLPLVALLWLAHSHCPRLSLQSWALKALQPLPCLPRPPVVGSFHACVSSWDSASFWPSHLLSYSLRSTSPFASSQPTSCVCPVVLTGQPTAVGTVLAQSSPSGVCERVGVPNVAAHNSLSTAVFLFLWIAFAHLSKCLLFKNFVCENCLWRIVLLSCAVIFPPVFHLL